jgi:hypothetical protein
VRWSVAPRPKDPRSSTPGRISGTCHGTEWRPSERPAGKPRPAEAGHRAPRMSMSLSEMHGIRFCRGPPVGELDGCPRIVTGWSSFKPQNSYFSNPSRDAPGLPVAPSLQGHDHLKIPDIFRERIRWTPRCSQPDHRWSSTCRWRGGAAKVDRIHCARPREHFSG